jgi:type I restriction enzyme S subunit
MFEVALGRMLNAERATGPDVKPYVRNINVRWDHVDISDIAEMDFPLTERGKYALRAGDLLINEGGAGIGRSAIWQGELAECYFQKSVLRLRPKAPVRSQWMVECMRVAVAQNVLSVEGNLATIPHVPAESLRRMRFPFPDVTTQDRLLEQLRMRRGVDQDLVVALQAQAALLSEHRRALITAAVTGQLDIPEVAA